MERGRGGHERDRHRDRRRPRRAGVRPRALQRAGPALDLLGGADPRPGQRRAARGHRPHRRLSHRPPAQPRGRRPPPPRPSRRRCALELQRARRPPPRALRRPRRARAPGPHHRALVASGRRPRAQQLVRRRPAVAIPRRRRRAAAALGRRSRRRADRPRRGVFVVRTTSPGARARARPLLKLRLLGATARCCRSTAARPSCARGWPRSSRCCAPTPAATSAETLCADLHGDGGSPGSVRVEVSRLRKLLGPWIDTERYRLTCDVETDVRRIEGLLAPAGARGARSATPARCCRAPRRPASSASASISTPGCARRCMTSDDAEALWAWVQTPPGEDDLAAQKRLLRTLPFHDPRRSARRRTRGRRRVRRAVQRRVTPR